MDWRCVACDVMTDAYDDHAMKCMTGRGTIAKHDRCTTAISQLLHEAGVVHSLELVHMRGAGGKDRPADIFIDNWTGMAGGASVAVDIGVTTVTRGRPEDLERDGEDQLVTQPAFAFGCLQC